MGTTIHVPTALSVSFSSSSSSSSAAVNIPAAFCHRPSSFFCFPRTGPGLPRCSASAARFTFSDGILGFRRSSPIAAAYNDGVYIVGDFMTRKEKLLVVKPSTTVDEALEMLVENRVSGLPVVDDDWKLVGVVSDYDLLALDSISGSRGTDTGMFPEVDSTWKVFNEIHKLLSKTNGQVIVDVMTPAPLVVRESTNLEDAARLLLETRYRRLPVVDADGKLVGIITRGSIIRAALHIKRNNSEQEA